MLPPSKSRRLTEGGEGDGLAVRRRKTYTKTRLIAVAGAIGARDSVSVRLRKAGHGMAILLKRRSGV